MWMRRVACVFALSLAGVGLVGSPAVAGGGCLHGLPPSDGTGTTVRIRENCFDATVLHVEAGATVSWVNEDPESHTVTGVGDTWGSFDVLAPGDRVTYRFDANGVYVYSCIIHPGMVGAVVVGDGSGDAGLSPAAVLLSSKGSASTPTAGASPGRAGMWAILFAVSVAVGLALGLAIGKRRRTSVDPVGAV